MLIIDEDDIEFDGDAVLHQGRPFTGIMQAYHVNHVLAMECEYLDGFRAGTCKEWYPNGQLSRKWRAVRGVIQGEECEWHENGVLRSVSVYLHGAELSRDEWDDAGLLIGHREIDRQSSLFKYVSSLPQPAEELGDQDLNRHGQ